MRRIRLSMYLMSHFSEGMMFLCGIECFVFIGWNILEVLSYMFIRCQNKCWPMSRQWWTLCHGLLWLCLILGVCVTLVHFCFIYLILLMIQLLGLTSLVSCHSDFIRGLSFLADIYEEPLVETAPPAVVESDDHFCEKCNLQFSAKQEFSARMF